MAYPRDHHLLPTYLSCYVLLATYTLRSAALSFDYNFSIPGDLDRANLIYINDSYPAGDRIILTNMTSNLTGRVAHPQLLRLWDDRTGNRASFTTSFCFVINGSYNYERADGMAFFIGTMSLPTDSHGGYLGLFNNPHNPHPPPKTVGVEFDTNRNTWDPPPPIADHIGIDVNSITSNVTRDLPNLCLFGTMWANITYDAESTTMEVTFLSNLCEQPQPLKTTVDLRDAGVPQDAAIGFSAATGERLSESHELLSWSFHSTDVKPKTKLWVIPLSVAVSVLAGLVAALLYIMYKRPPPATESKINLPVAREFSYDELHTATKNFSEDRKLGEGAFGAVYRGDLPDLDMPQVAVKRLKLRSDSEAAREEYRTEIMTLGLLRHRNLVTLVGWCNGVGNDLLLVYELIQNGSVHDHLHGSARTLTWEERYKIVLGIGSAIEYLHTGNEKCILHRDIKPGNVMLDELFEAKVADFGLVRQVPHEQRSHVMTIAGCRAYMDPVDIATNKASSASDVYSFGVLLLEIATGTEPTVPEDDNRLPNTLINAVRGSYDRNAVLEMADERLNGEFDRSQMERVMIVGLICVRQKRGDRPSIRKALDLLSNLDHPAPGIHV